VDQGKIQGLIKERFRGGSRKDSRVDQGKIQGLIKERFRDRSKKDSRVDQGKIQRWTAGDYELRIVFINLKISY
jgi:hypothetical protein